MRMEHLERLPPLRASPDATPRLALGGAGVWAAPGSGTPGAGFGRDGDGGGGAGPGSGVSRAEEARRQLQNSVALALSESREAARERALQGTAASTVVPDAARDRRVPDPFA